MAYSSVAPTDTATPRSTPKPTTPTAANTPNASSTREMRASRMKACRRTGWPPPAAGWPTERPAAAEKRPAEQAHDHGQRRRRADADQRRRAARHQSHGRARNRRPSRRSPGTVRRPRWPRRSRPVRGSDRYARRCGREAAGGDDAAGKLTTSTPAAPSSMSSTPSRRTGRLSAGRWPALAHHGNAHAGKIEGPGRRAHHQQDGTGPVGPPALDGDQQQAGTQPQPQRRDADFRQAARQFQEGMDQAAVAQSRGRSR